MKLSITIDDETTEVKVKPVDLVAFERQYDVSWAEVEKNPKIEHTMWLGWTAATRTGLTSDDFDTWLASVDDVEGEEPVADPLASTDDSGGS